MYIRRTTVVIWRSIIWSNAVIVYNDLSGWYLFHKLYINTKFWVNTMSTLHEVKNRTYQRGWITCCFRTIILPFHGSVVISSAEYYKNATLAFVALAEQGERYHQHFSESFVSDNYCDVISEGIVWCQGCLLHLQFNGVTLTRRSFTRQQKDK